jgi:hypothetical protein
MDAHPIRVVRSEGADELRYMLGAHPKVQQTRLVAAGDTAFQALTPAEPPRSLNLLTADRNPLLVAIGAIRCDEVSKSNQVQQPAVGQRTTRATKTCCAGSVPANEPRSKYCIAATSCGSPASWSAS